MKTDYTAAIHPRHGYTCTNAGAFSDASSAGVTLQHESGCIVSGTLVAGQWGYHVTQNKARTRKLTPSHRAAIAEACAALAVYLPPEWHAEHARMYAEG